MTGPPPGTRSRDPGVYSRPGAASVRPSAMWDAIYELSLGNVAGITPEGAQALVDDGIAAHEAKEDPHTVYVTTEEGDLRWGASSGLAPHTHEATDSGGLIDYLRTQWGTDHVNPLANPHTQYTRVPAVQAMIDAALANYYTKAQADSAFLTQAEADSLYKPIGYTPDLSGYYTKVQSDARYEPIDTMYTKAESDARYQPVGAYLTQVTGDARYLQLTGGALSGALSVLSKNVGLSPNANQTLQWLANGFFSDAPSKASYDALVARVVTLEAQVATLIGQMGPGATGHYHPMGTWRQTAKAVLPTAVFEEAPAA